MEGSSTLRETFNSKMSGKSRKGSCTGAHRLAMKPRWSLCVPFQEKCIPLDIDKLPRLFYEGNALMVKTSLFVLWKAYI